jgi:primosomal protein N' (replication factor Y)
MSILRLAIPSPLRRQFDYLPPTGSSPAEIAALRPGVRIRVPFGSREVTGFLLAVCSDSQVPASALKPALEILDAAPLVDSKLLELAQWAATYYHHPPGEVFSSLFPKRLREGKSQQAQGIEGWQLTTRGKGLPPAGLKRSPKQASAIEILNAGHRVASSEFKANGISAAVLRSLVEKDLVESVTIQQPHSKAVAGPALDLNPEQADAVQTMLKASESFSCHLLEGVTGSGKTEVYLQLIEDCLQRDRQALVLIPEIGLTPQTLERFQQRFTANIVVLHSGLTDAQRYQAWEAARTGQAHIVMGTRSAIFTPMLNPGLIVVDEEHDNSFKQQDGFRYSARDVAVKRGQVHDCPVLLGSATPSLESIHNADSGRYQHHKLTQRAGAGQMPSLRALDVRRLPLEAGLSPELLAAIDRMLGLGRQSLLFLNRRGYAPTLQCHDCGWVAECKACDSRLTVHRRKRHLRCHHCGATSALPPRCPDCHSQQLMTAGLGTEQTEDFLRERFAKWPIYRVDSDSMQSKNAMVDLVQEIKKGEPCILLGTQMLTKGHHFPGVSLVAVIDADALLFSTDFRGEERMAQLLTQVAGRAGREELPGEVLLQTHYPDHDAIQALLSTSYADQARDLLKGRLASGLPPAGQLVVLRSDCKDARYGEQFLHDLRQRSAAHLPPGAGMIGPLPSPMQRRAGRYRSQLLLTAPNRKVAQQAATVLVANADSVKTRQGLNWSIDIDPQDLF